MNPKPERRQKPAREKFECPHCGADVFVGSPVCRECGSDAGTGWQDQEQIDYMSEVLPDGYRDVDAGRGDELPPVRTALWIKLTALVVALLLLACVVGVFA
ncbi:MAG: hypothetical protein WAT39_02495 [Planctomycetota bacterium]